MSTTLKEKELEIFTDEIMNKIHHIDCLEFMKQVPDNYFQLLIVDPPYFEIKGEFDFIWKTFDDYLSWIEELAVEFKRILSDNGSLYVYGHAKRIAYKQIIFDRYFNLENNLVWYKPDSRTKKGIGNYRSYAPATERILFYSNEIVEIEGKCVFNTREYIRVEIMRAKGKIKFKDINTALGTATNGGGVASAVLSLDKKEPVMITREHYHLLKIWLNNKQEYEYLRKEYEDLRRPFTNTHFEDVLFFYQEIQNYNKYKHPTQKPELLSKELIKVSSNKNTKVFIPFVGSGTEAEACKSLGLDWCGCELELDYVNIANKRLEKVQGSLF